MIWRTVHRHVTGSHEKCFITDISSMVLTFDCLDGRQKKKLSFLFF